MIPFFDVSLLLNSFPNLYSLSFYNGFENCSFLEPIIHNKLLILKIYNLDLEENVKNCNF